MSRSCSILVAFMIVSVLQSEASATSWRLEVIAQANLDGHDGYLITSQDEAAQPDTLFVVDEFGYSRLLARKSAGGADWISVVPAAYLGPSMNVKVRDTWAYPPDEAGSARYATHEGYSLFTFQGTLHLSLICLVRTYANPGVISENVSYIAGIGLMGRRIGSELHRDSLASFAIAGGTGYFPLAVGNWWEYESVAVAAADIPTPRIALNSAVPNPFNPSTEISFELAETALVSVRVFDIAGRIVQTLYCGQAVAGRHSARWNGRDFEGRDVASGAYICRLEVEGEVVARPMTLLR